MMVGLDRHTSALVVFSLLLAVGALAYASGTEEVGSPELILFGLLPMMLLDCVVWAARVIAVGAVNDDYNLDLKGLPGVLFMCIMSLHFAIFGVIFWCALLAVGAFAFDHPAVPLRAVISLTILFLFTALARNALVHVLIWRDRRGKIAKRSI